jgi:ATP-dependent HslUV protease ATP-binding subunit HslU
VLEKVLEEISFTAGDRSGESLHIDGAYVRDRIGALANDTDLSKFIL